MDQMNEPKPVRLSRAVYGYAIALTLALTGLAFTLATRLDPDVAAAWDSWGLWQKIANLILLFILMSPLAVFATAFLVVPAIRSRDLLDR